MIDVTDPTKFVREGGDGEGNFGHRPLNEGQRPAQSHAVNKGQRVTMVTGEDTRGQKPVEALIPVFPADPQPQPRQPSQPPTEKK